MSIPFDLDQLIADRPMGLDESLWTYREQCAFQNLKTTWCQVRCNAWGTDEDWEKIEHLFDGFGKYHPTVSTSPELT